MIRGSSPTRGAALGLRGALRGAAASLVAAGAAVALVPALALAIGGGGCTVLVDPEAAQCTSDRDCVRFAGTICEQGGCVPRDASADTAIDPNFPCTSTQDCEAFHPTRYWVCRSSHCIALASSDCGSVIGDYTADDVLLLGAILPIFGPHKSSGIAMERALAFAADEDFKGGVPFGQGGTTHPVALVLCDESADPVRAAHHLTDDVKVPAILGPARSEAFLKVAPVASTAGVLLLSPYATGDLSTLLQGDLVWRTSPLATREGASMAALVSTLLEPQIHAVSTPKSINVALVYKDDPDARALRAPLLASLRFNGQSVAENTISGLFTAVSYGDPDDAKQDAMSAAVSTALHLASPPDLVILIGETEAVNGVMKAIEEAWESQYGQSRHPYFLLSHGMQTAELLSLVVDHPDLAGRVITAVPGGDPHTNTSLFDLGLRYRSLYKDYPVEAFGFSQTYDAFYLLAYGLSAVRNVDIIGRDVRDGMLKILGTPSDITIAAGPKSISVALSEIAGGKSIAIDGASGTYAFDFATGTSPSDVQTWCITQAGASPVFAAANVVYRWATDALEGTLNPSCLK